MFYSIDLPRKAICGQFDYSTEIPFFQRAKRIEFKPGLNILFGPNGSGKSTILSLLAFRMAALQGGTSVVTEDFLWKLFPDRFTDKTKSVADGYDVSHDGKGCVYINPRQTIGLVGGGFDDDFVSQGIGNIMARGSTGQTTLRRLGVAFNLFQQEIKPSAFYPLGKDPVTVAAAKQKQETTKKGKLTSRTARSFARSEPPVLKKLVRAEFPEEVHFSVKKEQVNNLWGAWIEGCKKAIAANAEIGQRTILLDEPESGLSPLIQSSIWEIMSHPKVVSQYQVIVATHSPFALDIPGAHVIELEEGYVAECINAFKGKFGG